MTFHLGDRVCHRYRGYGTVVHAAPAPFLTMVKFDEDVDGDIVFCFEGDLLPCYPAPTSTVDRDGFLSLLTRKEDRP